jgi:hypothetical protein
MCSELPTAVEAIHAALEDHCQVYVHCDNITGNYRSATVVVAYMIKYHDMLLTRRSTMYRPVDARLSFSENITLWTHSSNTVFHKYLFVTMDTEKIASLCQDSERDWLCRSARCVGTYRWIGYTEYKQVFVQCFADILSPVLLASLMNTSERYHSDTHVGSEWVRWRTSRSSRDTWGAYVHRYTHSNVP